MTNRVVFMAGVDPQRKYGGHASGGHSSFVRAHARAAIRAGFEPHLFFAGTKTQVVDSPLGVLHETASPFGAPTLMKLPLINPLVAAAAESFLMTQAGEQLIHGFGVWGYSGTAASRRLKQRGRQVTSLVSAYTTMKHERYGKLHGIRAVGNHRQRCLAWVEYLAARTVLARYEREQFLNAARVLFNYESVRRIIVEQFGTAINFSKMPYCAETSFQESSLMNRHSAAPEAITRLEDSDAPLIVALSRHDPRKGLDVLLHALAALRARRVPFRACLVGGGVLLERHRKLAEQLRLLDVITITGRVEEPFDYLLQADIFVLPSLEEGSGSVSLLEALQAGASIVASDVDGIPEDVGHGESALLVPPGDFAALTEALQMLLVDADLRKRFSQRGRLVYDQRFSAGILVEALRQLYGEFGFIGKARSANLISGESRVGIAPGAPPTSFHRLPKPNTPSLLDGPSFSCVPEHPVMPSGPHSLE